MTDSLSKLARAMSSPEIYCDDTEPSMTYRPASMFPETSISLSSRRFVTVTPKGFKHSTISSMGLSMSLPRVLKMSFFAAEDLHARATGIMKRSVDPLSLQFKIIVSSSLFSSARRHDLVALMSSLSSGDSSR